MKNNVTEGAIVQHLAKLRTRRVDAGKEVPPPLRRGGVGSSNKSSGNVPTRTASGSKRNLRAPLSAGSEEDEGLEMNFHDDASSDEDYIDKGRRRSRPKKQLHKPQPREVIPIKSEDEDMDGSNDGFGELLVPGAEFLQYPNEQEPHSEPTSSPVSDNATSKLVTLRYRQPVGNMFSGFPSTYAHYWNLISTWRINTCLDIILSRECLQLFLKTLLLTSPPSGKIKTFTIHHMLATSIQLITIPLMTRLVVSFMVP
ncbi:unnamed protein product [Aspergillus oryzae RIB40]|uniref:DNA, SC011 n=1 Tax=Aspergillus oryzae (strain ATCC 42149 / RIB 40) TaxID=510516 RepID=Q2TZQ4_ASPOR|nr:unnamed protein product [Aspergillus oryzae RIB40]BAE65211.1 unnamed protein product [Aspergillus oryzae RIB40]